MDRMSLKDLLSHMDQLEKEVKDLSRKAQQGEQYVHQIEESIAKDMDKGAEIEKRIAVLGKDIREWEEREQWLLHALDSSHQSMSLLEQMETEVKMKLDQERNTTNDLYHKLSSNLEKMRTKIDSDKDKLRQIPDSASLLSLKESISDKTKKLAENKAKIAQLRQHNTLLQEELQSQVGDSSWDKFQGVCIKLAETCLQQTASDRVNVVVSSGDVTFPPSLGLIDQEETMDVTETGDATAYAGDVEARTEKIPEHFSDASMSSFLDKDLSEVSAEPPTPRTKALHLKLGTTLLTLKKSRQDNFPKPPQLVKASSKTTLSPASIPSKELSVKSVTTQVASSPNKASDSKESRSCKARSRPSSPIPRIIGSMFSGRSSSSSRPASLSRVSSTEKRSQIKSAEKSRSRPSSPIPKLLSSVFSSRPDGSPVTLKSLRLGLPTLFQRKKSNLGQEDVETTRKVSKEASPANTSHTPRRQESFHAATLDASKQRFSLLGPRSMATTPLSETVPKLRNPMTRDKAKDDVASLSLKIPVKTPSEISLSSALSPSKESIATPVKALSPAKKGPYLRMPSNSSMKAVSPGKVSSSDPVTTTALIQSINTLQSPLKVFSPAPDQAQLPQATSQGVPQQFLDISETSPKLGNDSFVRNLFVGEDNGEGKNDVYDNMVSDDEEFFNEDGKNIADNLERKESGGDVFSRDMLSNEEVDGKKMERQESGGEDFFGGDSMWSNKDDSGSFFDLNKDAEADSPEFSFSFGTQNDEKDSGDGGF